jgi:hypothetical protein
MGKRGKQTWSKKPLPVGTIKQRRRRKNSGSGWINVRFVKVRASGPKGRRWIPLAKYTWEQTYGPVPPGMRVVHADGNTLNDNPKNYRLMTAGEVIQLAHRLDWQMSDENRRGHKRREATAACNRLRGQVRRAISFLPTRWYLFDPVNRVVFDEPFRSRRKLAEKIGVQIELNGAIAARRLAELPYKFCRGHELEELPRSTIQRRPFAEAEKRNPS